MVYIQYYSLKIRRWRRGVNNRITGKPPRIPRDVPTLGFTVQSHAALLERARLLTPLETSTETKTSSLFFTGLARVVP